MPTTAACLHAFTLQPAEIDYSTPVLSNQQEMLIN